MDFRRSTIGAISLAGALFAATTFASAGAMIPLPGDPLVITSGKVSGTKLGSGPAIAKVVRSASCRRTSSLIVFSRLEAAATGQLGRHLECRSQGTGMHPGAARPRHQSLFRRGAD